MTVKICFAVIDSFAKSILFFLVFFFQSEKEDMFSFNKFHTKILFLQDDKALEDFLRISSSATKDDIVKYGDIFHRSLVIDLKKVENLPKDKREVIYNAFNLLFPKNGIGFLSNDDYKKYSKDATEQLGILKNTFGESSWTYINTVNFWTFFRVYQEPDKISEIEVLEILNKNRLFFGSGSYGESLGLHIAAHFYYQNKNYKNCKRYASLVLSNREKNKAFDEVLGPIALLAASSFRLGEIDEFKNYLMKIPQELLDSFDENEIRHNFLINSICSEYYLSIDKPRVALRHQELAVAASAKMNGFFKEPTVLSAIKLRDIFYRIKDFRQMRSIESLYKLHPLPKQDDEMK